MKGDMIWKVLWAKDYRYLPYKMPGENSAEGEHVFDILWDNEIQSRMAI